VFKKYIFHIFILIILVQVPKNLGAEDNLNKVPMDHRVKAAFLCKFIKYMDWPSYVITRDEGEFVIGVYGDSPITGNLFSIMPKEVAGWKLKIIKINDINQVIDTHMVFLSSSEEGQYSEIIDLLDKRSVLTVSDNHNFLPMGGITNFFTLDKMVRFEISLAAADAANIKISSKLLRLAKIYNEGPK
jgi:hypothetical protein